MASCYRPNCLCHPSDCVCLVDGRRLCYAPVQAYKDKDLLLEETRNQAVKQPELRMLVGLPLSGKTTFRRHMWADYLRSVPVISSDDYIEAMGRLHQLDYNDSFPIFIDAANKACFAMAQYSASRGHNVIWDQTNLTEKSRKSKLAFFHDKSNWTYKKVAYYFIPPDHSLLLKRQDRRIDKKIPENVLLSMRDQLQIPGLSEGFDQIIHVCGKSGGIVFDSAENKFYDAAEKPSQDIPKKSRKERLKEDMIAVYKMRFEEAVVPSAKLKVRMDFLQQLALVEEKPFISDALIEEVDGYLGYSEH